MLHIDETSIEKDLVLSVLLFVDLVGWTVGALEALFISLYNALEVVY